MKKLIYLIGLSLILHGCVLAQYGSTHPTIYLISLSKDTVNLGDTLSIKYFYHDPSMFPYTYTNAQIQLMNPFDGNVPVLYQTSNFHSLDTFSFVSMYNDIWGGNDSLFEMNVIIPIGFSTGNSTIITMNDAPSNFNSKLIYIRLVNVSNLGISNYSINRTIKEINYYNLLGQKIIELPKNEIIIKEIIYTDKLIQIKKVSVSANPI